MTLRDTVVRNTFWYGLITVAGLGSGLLMSVVLARGLGPAQMGDYSFLLWIARMVHAVAVLGLALATVRYTAAAFGQGDGARASAFLRFFLRRQIASTTLIVALLLPIVLLWDPSGLRWPIIVILLGCFPVTIEGIYSASVYGAQRYEVSSRVSAVKMTLHLLSATVIVALGGGVVGVMIGGMLGTTVSCLLLRRGARPLYPEAPGTIPADTRRDLWGYLLPLSVVAVLETLVWDRSEVFFLRLYASREDIAFYSLAFGLAIKVMVLPEILIGAILPALSSLHGTGDHAEFARVYRTTLRYVTLVGAPLAVLGWALAPAIIEVLYGARYLPVGHLLGPLLLIAVGGVMRQVAWSALFAAGDRRSALNATWVSAVVNVGAAAYLIPRYGTMGAVGANACGQILASAWAFIAVARRHQCRFPLADVAKVSVAAAAGLAVTLVLRPAGLHPAPMIVAAVAGLATFSLVAVLTGVVGTREWTFFRASTSWLARRLATWFSDHVLTVLGIP